ncbi:MAG TPA: hypothetical protein VK534_02065, partial [Methylomirabilota bacterium]|nr:hypothetical protein [Methylomirabilota bacterium]
FPKEGVEIETEDTHAVATVYEPSALAAANDAAGGDAEEEVAEAEEGAEGEAAEGADGTTPGEAAGADESKPEDSDKKPDESKPE